MEARTGKVCIMSSTKNISADYGELTVSLDIKLVSSPTEYLGAAAVLALEGIKKSLRVRSHALLERLSRPKRGDRKDHVRGAFL